MKGRNVGATKDWQGLVTSDAWEEGVFHVPVRKRVIDVYLHLGGARRGRLTSTRLKNGVWYHVAVTADTQKRLIQLYVNGQAQADDDISRLSTGIKLSNQVIGREVGKRYFDGIIDDVRIYGRALTPAEVRGLCPNARPLFRRDRRNVRAGYRIPDESYCDQPYVVVSNDGNWLCTLTTGRGHEGQRGQHIISTISRDKGRTWSEPVDIEPADGPEASWVVPLVTPGGRVYAFYTYNGDNVRTLNGKAIRADTLGWYAYKYSDEHGRSWSKQRYRLPMRVTACDRGNNWKGKVQLFWGISKPIVYDQSASFAFTKLTRYMLVNGEGWFYRSDNILTERDVSKLRWELLPDGDHGLRHPRFGSVQEEHNIVTLSDGTLYCVYRTTMGYPCHAYSTDGGRSWTTPEHMTYCPGGRRMKTPRACPKVWRAKNGKFLFWFHNHSRRSFRGRNPVWISGGVEKGGRIHWSQPEILLYDPNPRVGMSYPDLIEQDGRYWFTETQKTTARVHEADQALLEGLWTQGDVKAVTQKGLLLSLGARELQAREAQLPKPLGLEEASGVSLDFWIALDSLAAGQVIVDSRDTTGQGFTVAAADAGTIQIELSDGKTQATWRSDPGLIEAGRLHHVAIIVDAGPQIITFVIDGVLCDGSSARERGWGKYAEPLGNVSGMGKLRLAPALKGQLKRLRVYDRYLRTSEAIGSYHAGPQ